MQMSLVCVSEKDAKSETCYQNVLCLRVGRIGVVLGKIGADTVDIY